MLHTSTNTRIKPFPERLPNYNNPLYSWCLTFHLRYACEGMLACEKMLAFNELQK